MPVFIRLLASRYDGRKALPLPSEGRGRRFESCRVRQEPLCRCGGLDPATPLSKSSLQAFRRSTGRRRCKPGMASIRDPVGKCHARVRRAASRAALLISVGRTARNFE